MIYFSAFTIALLIVYMVTFLVIMGKNYRYLNNHTDGLTLFVMLSVGIFTATLIAQLIDYKSLTGLDATKNFSLAILISIANKIHRKRFKK